jgi:hypothetical protein
MVGHLWALSGQDGTGWGQHKAEGNGSGGLGWAQQPLLHPATRGSSNYGTRPASLLLRLLMQKWRPSPTPPTNRTFSHKKSLAKRVVIAL